MKNTSSIIKEIICSPNGQRSASQPFFNHGTLSRNRSPDGTLHIVHLRNFFIYMYKTQSQIMMYNNYVLYIYIYIYIHTHFNIYLIMLKYTQPDVYTIYRCTLSFNYIQCSLCSNDKAVPIKIICGIISRILQQKSGKNNCKKG